jgi:hypothetical protein
LTVTVSLPTAEAAGREAIKTDPSFSPGFAARIVPLTLRIELPINPAPSTVNTTFPVEPGGAKLAHPMDGTGWFGFCVGQGSGAPNDVMHWGALVWLLLGGVNVSIVAMAIG